MSRRDFLRQIPQIPKFQIRLVFFRKLPSKLNVKKPFKFQQFLYEKLLISLANSDIFKSNFEKPLHSFEEEILFLPLVILRKICNEFCFCA